jgi:hypothetical protein
MGLKMVRFWGFNDAFPYAPGKYNAMQGRGLDYVIAEAGSRGIRVELALANFWNGELLCDLPQHCEDRLCIQPVVFAAE